MKLYGRNYTEELVNEEHEVTTTSDGGTKRGLDVSQIGDLKIGIDYDTIVASGTATTTETYVYKLAAATVRTIVITYTDATKTDFTAAFS